MLQLLLGGEGLLDEDFGRIPGAAHKLSYQYILVSLLNGVKVDGLSDEWRRISEDVQKAKSVLKNNYGIIDYSFSVDNISTYLKNVCGIEGS